jgi:hypothetical protein
MILYHTYHAPDKLKRKAFNSGSPIMILERVAPARIYSRADIHNPNVIGILKSTSFRNLNLNNSPISITQKARPNDPIKENYHSKLIFETEGIKCDYEKPNIHIEEELFQKVELWYNFASYDMMDAYIKSKNVISSNRQYDIGFYGTTVYSDASRAITIHRKKCLARIKKLKNCRHDLSSKRVKGKQNYINNITKCKIGISPWGLGEKCYRDFEVIYGGGILVKPDTSFVVDWIDSYDPKNKFYIPCQIDFSDLQQKLDDIKRNWKAYTNFRRSARERLIKQCWNEHAIAKHVFQIFTRCSERIK